MEGDGGSSKAESQSLSQSILSMIPLTKAHRRAVRQLRTMTLELEDEAVNAEIRRVGTIRHMMDGGQHDDALRELLDDTDSDLHYFNRLRRQLLVEREDTCINREQHHQCAGRKKGDEVNTDSDPTSCSTSPPSPPAKLCQWLGVDPNTGCKYHCVNSCVTHPWKVYRNVYGDEEPLRLDFCPYHVRYCLDPKMRHFVMTGSGGHSTSSGGTGEDLIEIHCPNQYGLCNGCYVQSHRHRPPLPGSCRIPGRRRLVEDEKQGEIKKEYSKEDTVKVEGAKLLEMADRNRMGKDRSISWKDIDFAYKQEEKASRGWPAALCATALLSVSKKVGATATQIKARKSLVNQSNALKRAFAGGHNAARIQRAWREYLARKEASDRFKELDAAHRELAAIRIQTVVRGILRRRRLVESLHRISRAALCLCCVSRGFSGRLAARKIRAALRIQQTWRHHVKNAKRFHQIQYQELLLCASRTGAASAIQRWAHKRIRALRWRRYIQISDQAIERLSSHPSCVNNTCIGHFGRIKSEEKIGCEYSDAPVPTSEEEASLASSSAFSNSPPTSEDESVSNGSDISQYKEERNSGTDNEVHVGDQCIPATEEIVQHDGDYMYDNDCTESAHEVQKSELKSEGSDHLPNNQLGIDETIFWKHGTAKRGLISKHKFRRALMEIWEANDSILLQPEFDAIVDLFDRHRTGSIDFESFIQFARLQSMPCQVHSRLVCTVCVIYGGSLHDIGDGRYSACTAFESSPNSSQICRCGRYKGAHLIQPKPIVTHSVAKDIITHEEMARIFTLKRQPDLALPFGVTARLSGSDNH